MRILNTNGKIYLVNPIGEKVEVINIAFSEYYNPIGTTPQQQQVNVINPNLNTIDSFYFLSEKDGINYNAIQTNETALPLLELYMLLIPKKDLHLTKFISEVLSSYFIKEGYKLLTI